MSLPPPPPPLPLLLLANNDKSLSPELSSNQNDPSEGTINGIISGNNEARTCYESKCIGADEALVQIEKACSFELELLSRSEDVGMLVVAQPLLQPVVQNGPVCGLVALVEAGGVLGVELNPDEVLAKAVEMGVTKQGEMFSSEAMQALAEMFFGLRVRLLDTREKETFTELVSHCLKGNPCLVPYDADRNHSPSLRKGHAAHWAVIHGIATTLPISTMRDSFTQTENNTVVMLHPNAKNNEEITALVNKFTADRSYVVAHQGKSYRTALWKYQDLIRSNQNLQEISPKLTADIDSYKLYAIEEGLCSKILLLES